MLELDGKYIFGSAKVGEKGQIVIPKDARDTFGIKPGDSVMVVGDAKSGLALITDKTLAAMFSGIFSGTIPTPPPGAAPMTPPQGFSPQGADGVPAMPQGFPSQGFAPQGVDGFPAMPQGFPSQGFAPQGVDGFPAMPQAFAAQGTAPATPPRENAARKNADEK